MQERISLIEAKLSRNRQSTQHLSSERSSPVTQTSTNHMMEQLHVSQRHETAGQKSVGLTSSLSQTSSADCSSSVSSLTTSKLKVCEKPGDTDITFVSFVTKECRILLDAM